MRNILWIGCFGLLAGLLSAAAQPNDQGSGEFSAYTGAVIGDIDRTATIGAGAGVPIARLVTAFIETSYIPLGHETLRVYPGLTVADSRLYDFSFAIHIKVPVKRRWVSYAVLGSSVLYNTYSIASTHLPGQNDAKFGFDGGGGVRYYIKDNWGIQSEVRYTVSSQNLSRLLWGVFYEVDDAWPFSFRRRGAHRAKSIPTL